MASVWHISPAQRRRKQQALLTAATSHQTTGLASRYFALISLHLFSFVAAQNPCAVNNLPTQPNFDPYKFEGDWYVNKRSHVSPFSNPFSSERETNLNIRFIPQAEGRIDAYMSYHMKFGSLGFCNKQKVHLFEEEEGGIPAKRIFKSQGILSSFAQLGGLTNLWVVSTDYSSYIILFSCTIDVTVTECPADNAQLFVLTKLPQLSPGTEDKVYKVIGANPCLESIYIVDEIQTKACSFVEPGDAFAEISLPGIYMIAAVAGVVLLGLLIVCCCCCCGN